MAERRLLRIVEWLPATTAPVGKRVLVCGGGPPALATLDPLGNWRAQWGGRIRTAPPKFWMPIPERPREDELAPVRAVGAR